jgi:hypothetical protein
MAREIKYYSRRAAGTADASARELDGYKEKLLKLIPAEIVAAFMALKGLMDAAQQVPGIWTVQWIVFAGLLVLTPLVYWKAYGVRDPRQHILTSVAFIVWVFTIGGPFDRFFLDSSGALLPVKGIIASVILVFYSLLVPLLMPSKSKES